jgi:hypothetical protein
MDTQATQNRTPEWIKMYKDAEMFAEYVSLSSKLLKERPVLSNAEARVIRRMAEDIARMATYILDRKES